MEGFVPFPHCPGTGHTWCCASGHPGLTHKVRSLGMWLKLDTGMVVMLLLFRVLMGNQNQLASVQRVS